MSGPVAARRRTGRRRATARNRDARFPPVAGAGPGGDSSGAPLRKISVLVVDDVYLVRRQVAQLVAADERLELVGSADDGLEALALIEALRPDLVVLDLVMPKMGGAEVLERIRKDWSATKVLVLTGAPSPTLHDALESHPDSLLYKDAVAEAGHICDEIVAVATGGRDTEGRKNLRHARRIDQDRDLTASELAVLSCAAEDASAPEIAARLGRSVKTVRNQIQAIHRKLDVSTTTGAVAKAYEIGLLGLSKPAGPTPGQDAPTRRVSRTK